VGWGLGWGLDGTVSLLCSVADFSISGFENLSFATRELVNLKEGDRKEIIFCRWEVDATGSE